MNGAIRLRRRRPVTYLLTLETVNHGTEGNHQVTTRVVTWWLPRTVGEMVLVSIQPNCVDNEGGYLVVT